MWKRAELGIPWAVTIGPDNLLYVMDGGDFGGPTHPPEEHLLKLDLSGKILAKWGSFGNYDGQTCWGHPGGRAKLLHLWPGQTPPDDARGRMMITRSPFPWQLVLQPL